MARGSVVTSLGLDDAPFVSDGSTINGTLCIDVRKHDTTIGALTATLSCEERVGAKKTSSVILQEGLPAVPTSLPRGMHIYEFSVPLGSQSLASFPPSLHTRAKDDSVGVFWILDVRDSLGSVHAWQYVRVFPARPIPVSDENAASALYKKVHQRVLMLASLVAGPPHKERPKIFVMLFGPSYRIPKDGELCEVSVKLSVSVPQAGVFQSPNKAQLGLYATAAIGDAVVLSVCVAKLVTKTTVKETGVTYTSTNDIWERELDIILPQGTFDLSGDFADLELPPCSETTESTGLRRHYELKFIFVLRALHFANITRWITMSAPIKVLPASISLNDPLGVGSDSTEEPPPYVG